MKLPKIEIHSSDHCVQKCNHCSHAADIAPKKNYKPSDYEPHLQNIQAHGIRWEAIDILGGEPFINPQLANLARMCQQYAGSVSVYTNLYWLKDENSPQRYHDVLTTIDAIYYTLYGPLLFKNGGRSRVNELIQKLKEDYPKLIFRPLNQYTTKKVTEFAKIEFHKDPKPVTYTDCNFIVCKQLLHTGQVLGCCAARRIPDWPEIDQFDITGDFNTQQFINWYNKPVLDLCSHCCIATEGPTRVPWTLAE